jgi:large subunit ribosomal protein L33
MVRKKIKLVSTADTGYFYTTFKNTTNDRNDLTVKKYDPVVDKHVEFEEEELTS